MRIDPKEYDIEIQGDDGKWVRLDDVLNVDYSTSTLLNNYVPIKRIVDYISIDHIVDGKVALIVTDVDSVNICKRC